MARMGKRVLNSEVFEKAFPMIVRRRNRRRNTLLLSMLGIGLAGGATAYSMTKRKNSTNMKNMMQQFVNKAGNLNLNKMMKTSSSTQG